MILDILSKTFNLIAYNYLINFIFLKFNSNLLLQILKFIFVLLLLQFSITIFIFLEIFFLYFSFAFSIKKCCKVYYSLLNHESITYKSFINLVSYMFTGM